MEQKIKGNLCWQALSCNFFSILCYPIKEYDRRKEMPIEEKIERLIQWMVRYPKAEIGRTSSK